MLTTTNRIRAIPAAPSFLTYKRAFISRFITYVREALRASLIWGEVFLLTIWLTFFIPQSDRKYSFTNSYNFTMMIVSQLELGPPVFSCDIFALKQTKSFSSYLPFSSSLIFLENWWYYELECEEIVTNNKGSITYKFSRWQVCDCSVNEKNLEYINASFGVREVAC